MKTYKILQADFTIWKHLAYRALAEEAIARDRCAAIPFLFIVEA